MDEKLKKQQDEFQRKRKFADYLTRAKAAFANKDYDTCRENLREALMLYPKDLDAREMAADILLLKGKVKEAGNEFKAIYDEDNTRVKCEEKYAKCVLQMFNTEEKIREMEAIMHGESPRKDKNSGYTVFLSCIVPGLGRIIKEDYLTGAAVFIAYLVCIGLAVNSLDLRQGIFSLFMKPAAIIADIIWLGSLADTINIFKK